MRMMSRLAGLAVALAAFTTANARSLRGNETASEEEHRQMMRLLGAADCFDKTALSWTSQAEKGGILLNGKQFQVKGISWFGLERDEEMYGGLTIRPLGEILDFIAEHFNVLRLPYSVNIALAGADHKPFNWAIGGELQGKTTWEIVDKIIDEAGYRGLLVVLDQHLVDAPKYKFSEVWYQGVYTEEMSMQAWEFVLGRYQNRWNVFAADIRNEPHGIASWGESNPATDFNKFAERCINRLHAKYPDWKGLWMVEGVQYNAENDPIPKYPMWWGGNLIGARKWPITLDSPEAMDRLVYSPHIYGPSVYEHGYFKDPTYPNNLDKVWTDMYGFIVPDLKKGVIIGEWGGSMTGKDYEVQRMLGDWLKKQCIANNIWWALNPGSGDTGGLLGDDWRTVDWNKLNLLNDVQPHPSRAYPNKDNGPQVCVDWGSNPNGGCAVYN